MSVHKRGAVWAVEISHRGKKYRRSSQLWNRAAACEVERKLIEDLRAIDAGREPARTFNHAVERWIAEELPNKKGQRGHRTMLILLAPFMEGRLLTEGADVASEIRSKMLARGQAPATINRKLAVVRRLLSLSYRRWGWLDQPLHQRVGMLSERGERHIYLSAKNVEDLAATCPRAGDAILLAAYTGIRKGQMLSLTAANRVSDCIQLGTGGKTGRPQIIPLHPRVQHIELPLLVTPTILRKEWESARKKLGMNDVHFHDLRHTFASWLLQSGADLMHVREFLGHSTVAVTQRYAHLSTGHLREALERIGHKSDAMNLKKKRK